MLGRFRRFLSVQRNDYNRPQLDYSSPDENCLINRMQFLRFLEKTAGERVYPVSEELIESNCDVYPHTHQLRETVRTNQDMFIHFNVFVKVLLTDECEVQQPVLAYMRLDVLINLKKEIQMFAEVIPKITAFQRLINAECRVSNLFAQCYGARMSMKPGPAQLPDYSGAIFLASPHENYTFQTCETESTRNNGFSFDNSVLILRDMANFHAGTLAMRLKQNTLFQQEIFPIVNLEVKEYERVPPFESLFNELISCGLRGLELSNAQREAIRDALYLSRLNNRFSREEMDQTWYALSYSRYSMSYVMTKKEWPDDTNPSKLIDLHRVGFESCCKDLTNFIFTSVRPASFDGLQNLSLLLHAYLNQFYSTLRHHKVPTAQYSWSNFVAEFLAVGERTLADILMNIRTSFCRNYKGNGDPLLSSEYRKRITIVVDMMKQFKWIKPVDSTSTDSSPLSDLIKFD